MQFRRKCQVRGSGREEARVCAECQLRGVMRPSGGRRIGSARQPRPSTAG
jgi:hypothetical protein